MKKTIPILLLAVSFILVSFSNKKNVQLTTGESIHLNEDGAKLINRKGCTLCHHPEKEIVGPSFKQIAGAYKGSKEDLLAFFNGNAKSIVNPEEFQYMKPVLGQLKKMKPEEREAIASYIASLQ